MKQFFTLLSMGMICLASKSSFAQVNETFSTPVPSCWLMNNADYTNASKGINNSVSVELSNVVNSEIGTPYINVTTGSVTINFIYALSGNLQTGKTRTLTIGYQTNDGVFTALSSVINVTSTSTINFSNTYSVPNGSFRIVIKGTADGANDKVMIDNLSVTGNSYHYGATPCNPNPTANSDSYNSTTGTYTSVLDNDTDPNNELLTAELVLNSVDGNVVLNANGTFTFTPNAGFTGTKTTFTYRVKDNGYDPVYSTTNATVTINFPEPVILPVHLLGFQGSVNKDKAQLTWSVADNETGSYFEVQRSADGRKFENISVQFTSAKVGTENYTYADPTSIQDGAFYRLKVVNKDYSVAYSKVIRLKGASATADNKLTLLQNPVQSSLTFSYTAAMAETNEINIYNMAGVKVYSQKVMTQKGSNSMSLSLDGKIPAGSYVVEVSGTNARRTTQFVKF